MPNNPPPPPIDYDELAKMAVAEARGHRSSLIEAHHQALTRYETALWRGAWDTGYNQGWRDGYDAAVKVLDQMRSATPTPTTATRPEAVAPPLEEDDDAGPTAAQVVIDIIKNSPGMRGVEIVAAAANAGNPVKERTVRTALHRLKTAGAIVSVRERWYITGSSPQPDTEDMY